MADWLSYTLEDFLLFSPETYFRLFELHNAAVWPAPAVAVLLGLALLGLAASRMPWRGRAALLVLALAWAFVGFAFHLERYATINWAAPWFAAGFGVEAALLLGSALRGRPRLSSKGGRRMAGLALLVFALLLQPLVGPLLGRAWQGVELFGVAPDPTVVATLGVLALAERPPWHLLAIPLLWCLVGGATMWAMGAPDAAILPAAGALALAAAFARRSPRNAAEAALPERH